MLSYVRVEVQFWWTIFGFLSCLLFSSFADIVEIDSTIIASTSKYGRVLRMPFKLNDTVLVRVDAV